MKEAPEHRAWRAIIQRTSNPKCAVYVHYGRRGIRVCAAWRRSFSTFLAAVGRRPTAKHTIERIDNNKGYEPGNVRWATRTEQTRNRRVTLFVTTKGERITLREFADRNNWKYSTLIARLQRGWSVRRSVNTPPHRHIARRERRCAVCGVRFMPRENGVQTCSRRCNRTLAAASIQTLSAEQVRHIRKQRVRGVPARLLASKYGVCQAHIYAVCAGRRVWGPLAMAFGHKRAAERNSP
jgi:hypothetical protein